MALLMVLVFLGVFVVLALLMFASGEGASQRAKQALARLRLALVENTPTLRNVMVDIRKKELLSAVPLLNRLLLKLELAPRLRILLYQANLKWTAGALILMSVTAFAVCGDLVYQRTGAVVVCLVIGAIAGAIPIFFVLHKRTDRFNQFNQDLPEALDLMVSALRAGHSLVAALRLVANESPDPVGGEFRICFDEQNYGLDLRMAMENLVARVPLQDLRIVAAAILIQKESGGNLAEVLDEASNLIRERFKLKREVMVYTAQGRLTGWILSILPVVLGFLLYLINPDMMSVLWKREAGLHLLYAAGAMTAVGALIIRKIVNMEV
ncbi:MAG: type II secretion system F family protein [Acidobacteriaceae bacterium]|nr:type II secretion system F family protein [Acidobacteriaceae bacterium]